MVFGAIRDMMKIIIILFVLAAIIYCLFVAPKITATIASEKGLDYGKWFWNSIIFNILAIIYLLTLLDAKHHNEKRSLLILIFIYMGIFAGAYLIDRYNVF